MKLLKKFEQIFLHSSKNDEGSSEGKNVKNIFKNEVFVGIVNWILT